MNELATGIAILAGVAGIAVGWVGAARAGRKEVAQNVAAFTRVQVLLENLGKSVTKIEDGMGGFNISMSSMDRRVGLLEQQMNQIACTIGAPGFGRARARKPANHPIVGEE